MRKLSTSGGWGCLSIILLTGFGAFSQGIPSDTAFLTNAKKNAVELYKKTIAEQADLYNGGSYRDYPNRKDAEGHPYFVTDDWVDGSVYYDSGLYSNIGMLYDLITDKLVLDQPFSHFKLELISEKIKYFELSHRTFVRLVQLKNDSSIRTGFYDRLYNGKVKVFVKHKKEIKETTQNYGVKVEYLDKDQVYIYKDGRYYPVKTRGSVMKVFKDRKKDLRKDLRANKTLINFRNNRELAIATIARLYDEKAR